MGPESALSDSPFFPRVVAKTRVLGEVFDGNFLSSNPIERNLNGPQGVLGLSKAASCFVPSYY